jgi:hypothetical protein
MREYFLNVFTRLSSETVKFCQLPLSCTFKTLHCAVGKCMVPTMVLLCSLNIHCALHIRAVRTVQYISFSYDCNSHNNHNLCTNPNFAHENGFCFNRDEYKLMKMVLSAVNCYSIEILTTQFWNSWYYWPMCSSLLPFIINPSALIHLLSPPSSGICNT